MIGREHTLFSHAHRRRFADPEISGAFKKSATSPAGKIQDASYSSSQQPAQTADRVPIALNWMENRDVLYEKPVPLKHSCYSGMVVGASGHTPARY